MSTYNLFKNLKGEILMKMCKVVMSLVALFGSAFLLFGCDSKDEVVTPPVEDYIYDRQDFFEYYELSPHVGNPAYSEDIYDVSSTLNYRIAHLPTSYAHVGVEEGDQGRAIIDIEIELNNGYHDSGSVLRMILEELQNVLNNSNFEIFEYNIRVDFQEGKEYFTNGGAITDGGYGGHSYLVKGE